LPSWWFSWKNCHFVGRFFDFVIILRPITMYQDYFFLATVCGHCPSGRFFDFVIILRPITMYQDYLFFKLLSVATVRPASEEASSMDGWRDGFRGCFTPPAQKFSYIDVNSISPQSHTEHRWRCCDKILLTWMYSTLSITSGACHNSHLHTSPYQPPLVLELLLTLLTTNGWCVVSTHSKSIMA
jgi:hypothetical protein